MVETSKIPIWTIKPWDSGYITISVFDGDGQVFCLKGTPTQGCYYYSGDEDLAIYRTTPE